MATTTISSNQKSSGLTVSGGDTLLVLYGGTASATLVESGGALLDDGATVGTVVSAGGYEIDDGTAEGGVLAPGGELEIDGGSADDILVSGGVLSVAAGSVSGAIVQADGVLEEGEYFPGSDDGGRASATVVNAGGVEAVGFDSQDTLVRAGGAQIVLDGGFLSGGYAAGGATLSAGGTQIVSAGGGASATRVLSGAVLVLSSGGSSYAASVAAGGVEIVQSGGAATDTSVARGGLLVVLAGGSATGASAPAGALVSGASLVLASAGGAAGDGDVASDQSVAAGETQYVFSGGLTRGEIVESGAAQSVDGGSAGGTRVAASGTQDVYAGVASGADLAAGTQDVFGGAASGTSAGSGGVQSVYGGAAFDTVLSGGTQLVSGGETFGTYVGAGGTEILRLGSVSDSLVGGGGTAEMLGGAVSGGVVESGGDEIISSGASGAGLEVIAGGTLSILPGAVVTGGEIAFGYQTSGLLGIADTALVAARVEGFAAGDVIDLPDLAFVADSGATLSGGVLAVTQGGATDSIAMGPLAQPGAVVYETADATGGTELALACFAEGTRIATPDGDIAVERLRPGDSVTLATGGAAAIVWLGFRRVACRRHPRALDVMPVRVAAHAFGLGRPARDVLLSPDHAVFCEGVLIPIRYLLNDATVRRLDVAAITYWHIELAEHAVLLADGLPAESYLDTGNRRAFANGGAVAMAFPAFARQVWDRAGAAPLVTEGPARELVYRRLLAQAWALGWRAAPAAEGGSTWIAPARA